MSQFNNLTSLITHQSTLRLRHLTQVVGCKLSIENGSYDPVPSSPLPAILERKPVSKGFFFTLETADKKYYTSELQPSYNPSWHSFDLSCHFPQNLLSLKGIVFRVWLRKDPNEEDILILSYGINFSGLVPITKCLSSLIEELHPNSILFKLKKTYYIEPKSLKCSSNCDKGTLLYHTLLLPLSETKPSSSVSSICRLHDLCRRLWQLNQKSKNYQDSLEKFGIHENSEKVLLQEKVETLRIRVKTLREQLQYKENSLLTIRNTIENEDSLNHDKGIELLEGYQILNRYLTKMRNSEAELQEKINHFRDSSKKLYNLRRLFLKELWTIFRLYQNDDKKLSLCNVHLPDAEDYEGHSPQKLSVALGFVAQFLVRLAHLLDIPMRYPIKAFGSMSTIADLTSFQLQDVDKEFQLYTRGKEKEKLRFHYAVFLLNKNLAQLRWNCGLPTEDLRLTLRNLFLFVEALITCSNAEVKQPDVFVFFPSPPLERQSRNVDTPSLLLHRQNSDSKPSHHFESQLLKNLKYSNATPQSSTDQVNASKDPFNQFHSSPTSSSEILESESDKENYLTTSSCPVVKQISSSRDIKLDSDLSQSLDQGLDSICKMNSEVSYSKISEDLKDNLVTGSQPNLALEETVQQIVNPTEDVLRSWHEDDPTPYKSIAADEESLIKTKEKSVEKIVSNNESDVDNDVSEVGQSEAIIINASREKIEEMSKNMRNDFSKVTNDLNKEKEKDLNKDLTGIETLNLSLNDNFLNDVAFRTAALANQNCSFKFSFSRQSTQE